MTSRKTKSTGWGGKREGAGRKPGPEPRPWHFAREGLAARFPCHTTLRVRDDVPSLRSARLARELGRSWAVAADRGDFRLVCWAIQDDRAHLFVEAKDADALGRGMKAVGARFSRAVNRVFERRGPVLWDRYEHEVLKTPSQVRAALRAASAGGRSLRHVAPPHTKLLREARHFVR